MLDIKRVMASKPHDHAPEPLLPLTTPWGQRIVEGQVAGRDVLAEHPHPQFARSTFTNLNGWWEYALVQTASVDKARRCRDTALPPERFDGRIMVPFSPEALLSGVDRTVQPDQLLWYRRRIVLPADPPAATAADESGVRTETDGRLRLILHFEAVDYACSLLVNGQRLCAHRGGYLPFAVDVTDALHAGENTLALCVWDPSDQGTQPRGKQRLQPGNIWYTAQSGIWQSVWLEAVPDSHVVGATFHCDADAGTLEAVCRLSRGGKTLTVRVFTADGQLVAMKRTPVEAPAGTKLSWEPGAAGAAGRVAVHAPGNPATTRTLKLQIPHPRWWSPDDPYLYRIELRYGADAVHSYAAFRTVEVAPDAQGAPRVLLNHRPIFLRGVLDQGYWPDGLMTAPSDEALIYDIRTMRDAGFNLLRKHLKRECDRWYYHCDRLGMLVWQDMVSGGDTPDDWHTSYRPTLFRGSWGKHPDDVPETFAELGADDASYRRAWTATTQGIVRQLGSHPCIIGWTLFNEGWGQFESLRAVRAVRQADPTRPISAASGWYDQGAGDFFSVHNYFRPLAVWKDPARATAADLKRGSAVRTGPRAFVISEFGGVSWAVAGHVQQARSYGYADLHSLADWRQAVADLLAHADALQAEGLAGFVLTQLSDVQEETNGLLTCDRRVNKLDDGPAEPAGAPEAPVQDAPAVPDAAAGAPAQEKPRA